jgi:TfoX N-terminal domain
MAQHSDHDKARFAALIDPGPGIVVKPLFGSVGAWVNGNMFAALFSPDIGVKLAPSDHAELSALPGSGPFGPPQKPMGGYLALPPDSTDEQARAWIKRAHDYVATLPPKAQKPRATD